MEKKEILSKIIFAGMLAFVVGVLMSQWIFLAFSDFFGEDNIYECLRFSLLIFSLFFVFLLVIVFATVKSYVVIGKSIGDDVDELHPVIPQPILKLCVLLTLLICLSLVLGVYYESIFLMFVGSLISVVVIVSLIYLFYKKYYKKTGRDFSERKYKVIYAFGIVAWFLIYLLLISTVPELELHPRNPLSRYLFLGGLIIYFVFASILYRKYVPAKKS